VARRWALFILAAVLAFGFAVPSALAWCGDGDGYGTHDWVLAEAIRLAGPDASWVDVRAALLTSDDPDETTDWTMHGFRLRGPWGYGGAVQSTTDLYYEAVTSLGAGDRLAASRSLGLLSHYYSDVLQPFHAAYSTVLQNVLHSEYERAVDVYTRHSGQNEEWITAAARVPMVDVRAKTAAAACFSRADYPALAAALTATTPVDVTEPVVSAVTRAVLSRAANDLADIIAGISRGEGVSAPPATVKVTVSRRYPQPGSSICAYATCTDVAGRPIEGAAVTFLWPLASGSVVTTTVYTGPTGVAHDWETVGTRPLSVKASVRAVSAASGSERGSGTWFTPSAVLKTGTAGLRTWASNVTPQRESTITVYTVAHDRCGRHVAGLPVTYTLRYRTGAVVRTAFTDAMGVARLRTNIGACARGYRVIVTSRVLSAGVARSVSTSFVPR
jgi:hypothetical protein